MSRHTADSVKQYHASQVLILYALASNELAAARAIRDAHGTTDTVAFGYAWGRFCSARWQARFYRRVYVPAP